MFRTIQDVLLASAARTVSHQRGDGAFSFCCEVNPIPDAMMVIWLCLLGEGGNAHSGPLVGENRDEFVHGLCQDLLHHQKEDGSWTAYPDQKENVSATVLALFALRLAGYPNTNKMQRAKDYILAHGGLERSSYLAKITLAIAGQVPWSSLPDGHIEFMLLGKSFPINMYDLSSYARLHLVPFMVLSHLQFRYPVPAEKGLSDLHSGQSSTWIPNVNLPIKIQNDAALERSKKFILNHLEENGTIASYTSATLFAVAALQALGFPKHHPAIQKALQGLKGMAYPRKGRLHQQIFSSTVWDTSLSMQALQAAHRAISNDNAGGTGGPYERVLRSASRYLLSRQHARVGDWGVHAPGVKPGGWGFSDVNTLYPDMDDTAAALKALFPLREQFPSQWRRGVRWLVGMQNDDGGFAAFERNNNKNWLEHIPINDMGRAMTDPSTADLTGRVLDALTYIGGARKKPAVVERAREWLLHHQQADGSWYGRWGICYIYGTWAATIGLRGCGVPSNHPAMEKAETWFKSVQNQDGGFGESCRSEEVNRYEPLRFSTPSQTAWALMGMMASTATRTPQIDGAVEYLVQSTRPDGGWTENYPTGTGVAGQAYIRYHSYPYVWPVIALSQYLQRFGAS